MSSELRTERRESILLLTISDPPTRNALSDQVYAAGIEALGTAEADTQIRALVLQGEGAHFCSGGDVRRLAARRGAERAVGAHTIERFHEFVEALGAFPKPVLAAVEGAAAGAGFSLALACDLIVAADDARFSMAYARVGLSPDGGGAWQLAHALPRQLVAELLWLAEPLPARRLHELGVVNRLAAPGHARDVALEIAARLAACAPNAVASAKELLRAAARRTLGDHMAAERDHFLDNLFHANGGEGLAAFLGKRAPRFR